MSAHGVPGSRCIRPLLQNSVLRLPASNNSAYNNIPDPYYIRNLYIKAPPASGLLAVWAIAPHGVGAYTLQDPSLIGTS